MRHNPPTFLLPSPDRAIVYFVRSGDTASWKDADAIFVDDQPLGLLPKNAYLVASVEPGRRFVWWSTFLSFNSEWFDFNAGRTYLLRSTSHHGYWYLDNPGRLVEIVRATGLSQTTTTASGRAALRQQSQKKYRRLRQQGLRRYRRISGRTKEAEGPALPIAVGAVDYQHRLGRFKEPRLSDRFGELSVNSKHLRWRSKHGQVEIAVKDIREISFAGLSIREHVAWLRVRYGPEDAPREAFFHSPVDDGFTWSHNRKFAALAAAIETTGSR